ncbi:MAG: 4-vinyl reductase [Ectothiorhodospiraceae bacterium]|jgi:predicted hydrocarbon binding protein
MANITVHLDVEERSGILSSAVTKLRRHGLMLERHQMTNGDDDVQRRLVIEASGDVTDPEGLRDMLGGIRGVIRVANIEGVELASKPPATPAAAATEESTASAGDSEELADRVARAHPKIMQLVEEFEFSLSAGEREPRVRELGRAVGERVAPRYTPDSPVSGVPDAIEQVVVPALEHIARTEPDGERLRVPISLFTRRYLNNMDLVFGEELDHCYYLAGFIEGILAKTPGLSAPGVVETKCRAVGDDTCIFEARAG